VVHLDGEPKNCGKAFAPGIGINVGFI